MQACALPVKCKIFAAKAQIPHIASPQFLALVSTPEVAIAKYLQNLLFGQTWKLNVARKWREGGGNEYLHWMLMGAEVGTAT